MNWNTSTNICDCQPVWRAGTAPTVKRYRKTGSETMERVTRADRLTTEKRQALSKASSRVASAGFHVRESVNPGIHRQIEPTDKRHIAGRFSCVIWRRKCFTVR